MRLIRIGLAHPNPAVGAFRSNTDQIIAAVAELAAQRATIICFAEQCISGYPCEDLVLWEGFVRDQWKQLERIAAASAHLEHPSVIVVGVAVRESQLVYNAAAVICKGKILGIVPKEKLPTYGVFYEGRTFSGGVPARVSDIGGVPFGDLIFEFPFGVLAVEVCEDIWSPDGPMRRRAYSGAEIIVNCSASPWRAGVVEFRRSMIAVRAADNQATVVYVNLFGGNDSLVFDGGGYVNQNGALLRDFPRWRSGHVTLDLDLDRTAHERRENTTWRNDCQTFLAEYDPVLTISFPEGPKPNLPGFALARPSSAETQSKGAETYFEDLIAAMKTGLAGYFEKAGVFSRIGIALSGGKDSVLVLILSWLYARDRFSHLNEAERAHKIREFIHCFSMPTHFNSESTKTIAREICAELGVTFKELPIEDAFGREIEATRAMLSGRDATAFTMQNIQSRLRAMRMWNWANSAGALWLQSGNMSEKSVGYTTMGGDLMGGYSLIGNMPKTMVTALLHHLHATYRWPVLERLLHTVASAELAENQEDERDLMPYPVLDACFELFAGEKRMPLEVYHALRMRFTDEELRAMRPDYSPAMLKEWVKRFVKLFIGSIFKWVQAPQTVHLGSLDLDRERALQLPVVQSLEWLRLDDLENES